MKGLDNVSKLPPSRVLNTILNGADTCLYVSDINTNEILFINNNMKEHYNLTDEALGGICYQAIHNRQDGRCNFCPIKKLLKNKDESITWESYNDITGKYYRNIARLIEWCDGQLVHLQYSIDITNIKITGMSLKKRLDQQELMSSISQSFTSAGDTPKLIRNALKMAGEFMCVNQAFLSKYHHDKGYLECLHEWYDSKGQSYINNAKRWPLTPDMDIYKDFIVNGYAAVNSFAMLTHPNFEEVKGYDLKAFLNISVEVAGEFWGVIGFIINENEYVWSPSDIHLGKLLAGIFSGVLSRNIAEERLVEAKKIAEQASQAKGKFLSHMSHEMRTPMNAIIGMTGIARNADDIQKKDYCLERIDNASKQLLGLINDILDVSKIEANKLELSPTEFDFERMLMNVASVVIFRVEEKSQNLIINVDNGVPAVLFGDEMRLSQVLVNLVSNSTKFAPDSGIIVLNARMEGFLDDNITLHFEVIDNGIGISKDRQATLFNPFEQADGTIVRKYGGTGLGLTISKGIVELMGGNISVMSELGRGAKFSFTVNMKTGKNISQPELSKNIDKGDISMLVVDSALLIQDYFTRTMPGLGIKCDVAGSGEEAKKKIGESQYNIFILDWMLPDIDAVELAKNIKDYNKDSIVIMVLPQNDWSNIEHDAVAAGVKKFVYKPFFLSTLIDVINECMGITRDEEIGIESEDIYDFSNYAILAAEDIEINREILLAILEETSISIDFAFDGAQAVAMFKNNPDKYGLILMDIQMPVLDGYQAAKQIRELALENAKRIPIVAMTAHVYREDIEKCLHAGMNDHVGKPIDTGELLLKLDNYLNHNEEERIGEVS